MQKTCQKIVRVQNGLITEIYDGLVYRDFSDNDIALKELLMEDVGLDFDTILHTYEKLIYDLACSGLEVRSFLMKRLPEGWMDWAHAIYSEHGQEEKQLVHTTQPTL
ncbi:MULTISPECIES: hypothetical protein [Paenibacillus]|uniref:hypothetical protein n=1 Tax=Paenibacillus TaxID=44249 RepID=UPI0022B9138F|nr:hypothetical protein [Paenibacillus caseinilyticus]MCZ8520625.1 hypothetical protein [Paenibacillus caseinilyticus]